MSSRSFNSITLYTIASLEVKYSRSIEIIVKKPSLSLVGGRRGFVAHYSQYSNLSSPFITLLGCEDDSYIFNFVPSDFDEV